MNGSFTSPKWTSEHPNKPSCLGNFPRSKVYTLSETNSSPLKSSDWKTILSFCYGLVSRVLYVSQFQGFSIPENKQGTWK